MLVGRFVTIKAVLYQAEGQECHVNKTNSFLGLSMYASYFLLFFKLFAELRTALRRGARRRLCDAAEASTGGRPNT